MTGRAVAALKSAVLDERRLQGMKRVAFIAMSSRSPSATLLMAKRRSLNNGGGIVNLAIRA